MAFLSNFHVHTSRYSPCTHSSPQAMCQKTIDGDLVAIAFTEHITRWPPSEAKLPQSQFRE